MVEVHVVGAVGIDPQDGTAGDSRQLAGAAARHDEPELVGPVGSARRRRVDEVERATPTVDRAIEGLQGHVGASARRIVEGVGELGDAAALDVAGIGLDLRMCPVGRAVWMGGA